MRPTLKLLLSILLVAALGACSVQQTRLTDSQIQSAVHPAHKETTIALLGGTGFVGSFLLKEALSRGYPLRVLSRSPEKLAYLGSRVQVVTGDARDPAVLRELLSGADVVVSSIGPPRARGDSRSGLNSAVTTELMPVMAEAGIQRYLVVSGAGVAMAGDRRNLTGWWMRQLVRLRYPGILHDRQTEYGLLQESDLSWTLLRCPLIESGNFQSPPSARLDTPTGFYLRASELAHFVMEELEHGRFQRRGPFLNSD